MEPPDPSGASPGPEKVIIGSIVLDRATFRVHRSRREIRLGPTEFKLLEFLMRNPERGLTRTMLIAGVWGSAAALDERTVDVHVGRLRRALSRPREHDPIVTVRGVGYMFRYASNRDPERGRQAPGPRLR